MNDASMEDVYAALAEAIDAAGKEKETLFLAKVALLLACEVGDPDRVLSLVESAKRNLEGVRHASP